MDLTKKPASRVNGYYPASQSISSVLPQRRWCGGAREDPLTGLLAFPDFHRTLPSFLVSALEAGAMVALAIGDCDGLKEHVESTNSSDPASYGHLAGNAVMTSLGEVTRHWFHQQPWVAGCVATFGGDEVIIAVLEENPTKFLNVVRDLRDALKIALPVTVSFALAIVTPEHLPVDYEGAGAAIRFTDRLFATVDRCLFVHKAARRAARLPGGIVAITQPSTDVTPTAAGLFALPSPAGPPLHVTAALRRIGEQKVMLLPCLGPEGMRGQRLRVAPGYGSAVNEVVVSIDGQAAIAAPLDRAEGTLPVILSGIRGSSAHGVPDDLETALAGAGLDWRALPRHEQDQLLHLIREASDPTIRLARIEATLQAVAARTPRSPR